MRAGAATDPGRRRRHNEDAYVCQPPLFAIADGMGGAQAGEIASSLAAAVLEEGAGEGGGEEGVASLIQEANRRVFRRSSEDAAASGMGTTMTVALVDEGAGTIALGHVGDSRAYRVREGALEQLTDDHSLVGELVRSGKLSAEEAEVHPQRSVITRAVGTEPEVDVDTFTVEAEAADLYLLCSDGLTDMVRDDEILAVLAAAGDLERAARALVDAANAGGGEDNITVVLFAVGGDGEVADTVAMPALAESAPDDDEDTLSGLEPVPAVDTAVVHADDVRAHLEQTQANEPAAAVPARRRKRSFVPLALLVLLLFALVLLTIWGLYR